MSFYNERHYKVLLTVYAAIVAAFLVYIGVNLICDQHSHFKQEQCIRIKNTERWEHTTIYKVVEVGLKKYRVKSAVDNQEFYTLNYRENAGTNDIITLEESYPSIDKTDELMETVECPLELK